LNAVLLDMFVPPDRANVVRFVLRTSHRFLE